MKKESFIVSCIRRLREYGIGIIFADQSPTSLLEVIKANVFTIICLSLISQKDRREIISMLGLDSRQAAITNSLEPGQGLVRMAGRYPFPLLLNFPHIKSQNISEKELDEINATDQRTVYLLSKVKPASKNVITQEKASQNLIQYMPEMAKKANLEKKIEKAKAMLMDIFNRPFVVSTQRAKDFGLSGSAADKIFKYIEKEQLADVVALNLSGVRGGMSKYFVLTKHGYKAISKIPPKQSGGTGQKHFFMQRHLKKHLPEKGFNDLVMEKNIGGKRIDLLATYEDLKIGIEICVSTMKTEFMNVQKDSDKCDVLIIVTPDKKTKDKLYRELYKKIEPSENLKTCVVHELLNDPEKLIH